MRDRFVQEAVEASCFTFVFAQFFGFLRGPNHLIQLLRIGRKLINEASSLLRINQQAFAPLFRLVMFAFVSIICMFQSIQLFSHRLWLNAPHQLTDKLHLSSSGLTPFGRDGSINLKRIKQFVLSEFDFLKLLIRVLPVLVRVLEVPTCLVFLHFWMEPRRSLCRSVRHCNGSVCRSCL